VVKCLPQLIIIGAQKAGTTALTGLLMTHPTYVHAKRKEVHYFDRPPYAKVQAPGVGLGHYLRAFNYISRQQARALRYIVVGETTPRYLSALHAASRMHALIPRVKLVLLLRNPIDRLWSEYQMLARRVFQATGLCAGSRAGTDGARR